jgi:hypothetical protein
MSTFTGLSGLLRDSVMRLWVAPLLAACAVVVPHYPQADTLAIDAPVWVDSRFTKKEKAQVRQALEEWNGALGGYIHFYVQSEAIPKPSADLLVSSSSLVSFGMTVTVDWEPENGPFTDWHPQYLAWVPKVSQHDIHMVSTRIHDGHYDFRGIVEHEMGHVLGLDHIDTPGQLMSDGIENQVMCVDGDTLVRLSRLHGWSLSHMRASPDCK